MTTRPRAQSNSAAAIAAWRDRALVGYALADAGTWHCVVWGPAGMLTEQALADGQVRGWFKRHAGANRFQPLAALADLSGLSSDHFDSKVEVTAPLPAPPALSLRPDTAWELPLTGVPAV